MKINRLDKLKRIICVFVSAFMLFANTINTVNAAIGDTYTVTYNSVSGSGEEHEGTFEGGGTTNVVTYEVLEVPTVAYSHTANVDDTGKKLSNYGNS